MNEIQDILNNATIFTNQTVPKINKNVEQLLNVCNICITCKPLNSCMTLITSWSDAFTAYAKYLAVLMFALYNTYLTSDICIYCMHNMSLTCMFVLVFNKVLCVSCNRCCNLQTHYMNILHQRLYRVCRNGFDVTSICLNFTRHIINYGTVACIYCAHLVCLRYAYKIYGELCQCAGYID